MLQRDQLEVGKTYKSCSCKAKRTIKFIGKEFIVYEYEPKHLGSGENTCLINNFILANEEIKETPTKKYYQAIVEYEECPLPYLGAVARSSIYLDENGFMTNGTKYPGKIIKLLEDDFVEV